MTRALLVLATLLAGCSTYDPALLPDHEALRGVPQVTGHRVVVLAPVPPPEDLARDDVEERRGPMRFDPALLARELEDALARVAPGDAERPGVRVALDEREVQAAREQGYDVLVRARVARWDASFLGTNGWWVPNAFFLAWYFFPIGPQWLLADELYGVDVELEVTGELASSGRPLPTLRAKRVTLVSSLDEAQDQAPPPPPAFALTDMQRGIDWLGTYFPGDLDPDQWEAVGELLGPFAYRHAALRVAAAVADGLHRWDKEPVEVRRATAATTHALLVGVEDHGAGRPPCAGAADDARRLADALIQHAGVPERNVVQLVNDDATPEQLLATLARVAARCREDDTLVVAFAGRGVRVQDAEGALSRYALVLPQGAVDLAALLRAVKKATAFRRVLVLDCDFESGPRGDTVESLPLPRRALAATLAGQLDREDVVVLGSSGPDEAVQSWEDAERKAAGLLSTFVARALAGEADTGDDGLTIGDLARWLEQHVPHVALTLPRPQRPVVVPSGTPAEREGDLLRR